MTTDDDDFIFESFKQIGVFNESLRAFVKNGVIENTPCKELYDYLGKNFDTKLLKKFLLAYHDYLHGEDNCRCDFCRYFKHGENPIKAHNSKVGELA